MTRVPKIWAISTTTLLVLCLMSLPAFAACTTPAGNAGDVVYSSLNNVMAYCNGTSWIGMGVNQPVGFGTLTINDFCTATSGTQIACTTAGINLTSQVTGVLPATNGGTGVNNGVSTITLGGNLTTSGAFPLTFTTTGATSVTLPTTGTLVNTAVTTLSSLASIGTITTGVWDGTVIGPTYGGTGLSSYNKGDILYGSASNVLSALPIGTSGYILTASAGGLPTWAAAPATGVTSFSAGTTGLTPNTPSTGAIVLAGTLGVPNGGTGLTTLTSNVIYKGNGTGNLAVSGLTDNGTIVSSSESIDATGKSYITEIPDGSVATVLNTLAKLDTSGNATKALVSDTDGIVGIVVGGAGTTGTTAQIAIDGQATCTFDGTAVVGHFVTISSTTAGDCHDTGAATRSTTSQTIGRVLTGGTTATVALGLNGAGGGAAAGATTNVQYNNGGAFAGDASYTYTTPGVVGIGTAAGSTGVLKMSGTTSGTVSIQPAAVAGTYNFILPTSAGTAGQPLLSNAGTSAMAFGTLGFVGGGTGTATQFTTGSVVFAGASGIYTQNNAQLFWDNTNNRLGIGTATPTQALTVFGNVDVGGTNGYLTEIANAGTTGTTVNKLAKLNTSGAAVISATSDIDGMVGVVMGESAGGTSGVTTGNAQIAVHGQAICTFDTAPTTAGDFVTISSTTGGDCHDAGSSRSTSSQTIGQVLSTTPVSGSNYPITAALNAAGGGSGGSGTVWQMIASTDIASATASYTFSGLNGDTDGEYIIVGRFIGGSGSLTYFMVQPDGDTSSSDYGYQLTYSNGTAAAGQNSTAASGLYLAFTEGSGHLNQATATLYAKSGYTRTWISQDARDVSGATITYVSVDASSWTNTATAISSLTVAALSSPTSGATSITGGLGVGTHLELWTKRSVGGVAGSGTANYIPMWGSSSSLTTSALYQSGTTIGLSSTSPVASLDLSQKTDAVAMPVGTTGQEPASPVPGMLRYNSTTHAFEGYAGASPAWGSIGGASLTGGTTNYEARWTSATTLGTGALFDNATLVNVGTNTTTGSALNVYGNASIGNTYASVAAPTNGLIVLGSTGIGTSSPTQPLTVNGNVDAMGSGNGYITEITNDGATGTTVNELAKLTTSGNAIVAATSDTDNMVGIVVGGAGTTGSAQIAVGGQASCIFDGTTVAGHYAQISGTTAGYCHDSGSTARPLNQETIGRILTVNSGSGTTAKVALQLGTANVGGGQELGVATCSTAGGNYTITFTGAANSAPSVSSCNITLASNTAYMVVELWGAGGGGAGGDNGGTGGTGGSSCFGTNSTACTSATLTVTGGTGGTSGGAYGGAGGAGSGGNVNLTGGAGGSSIFSTNATANYSSGGTGGSAPLGGGGGAGRYTSAGTAGSSYGGGGGGGGLPGINGTYWAGAGGGAGGYSSLFVNSPSGTYYYTIGAAGTAGTAGSYAGGVGGPGGITITAYASVTGGVTAGSLTSGDLCSTNGTLVSCTTSVLPIANGGTNVGSQTTNGVAYFNGTSIITGSGFVYSGGDVGIGTSSPTDILNIYNATKAELEFTNSSSSYGGGLGVGNNSSAAWIWQNENLPLEFATNNAVHMYINAAGAVGIGTTGPAAPLSVLGYGSGTAPASSGTTDATMNFRAARGTVAVDIGMLDSGTGYLQNRNFANLATNFNFVLEPNGGNVGIGTTSPQGTLDVEGSGNIILNAGNVSIGTTNTNTYDQVAEGRPLLVAASDTSTTIGGSASMLTISNMNTTTSNTSALAFAAITGANPNHFADAEIVSIHGARTNAQYPTGQLAFLTSTALNTAPTEKMRITSAGNVGIGTTSPNAPLDVNGAVIIGTASGLGAINVPGMSIDPAGRIYITRSNADTVAEFNWQPTATRVGSITVTSSNAAYNTTSDRRLKENFAATKAGLNALMVLPVQDFNFISDKDKRRVQGFIAQDLYKIYPEAVTTNGDDGKIPLKDGRGWSVDYGRVTPLIVKAVQDLKALFDADHDAIAQLEADNANLRAANDNESAQIKALTARLDAVEAGRH